MRLQDSGSWRDTAELPETLAETLARADGFADVAGRLTGARRVVATGNGASWYAAHALGLAALSGGGPAVLAVPGGLVARRAFPWQPGDVLLAFSSSGEFRDVLEAIEDERAPRPFALVTATPHSSLGQAAGARATTVVRRQRGYTHTQAFAGAVAAALAVWAQVTGDAALARALERLPEAVAAQIERAPAWASESAERAGPPRAAIAFGTGPAWPAAQETALLLKEIALVPAEGMETREGATSGMYALAPGDLVVAHGEDALAAEAAATCAARGATVATVPAAGTDARLAAVADFAPSLALAVELALRAELDPDSPAWRAAYLATARR